jgi:hypothetical protein
MQETAAQTEPRLKKKLAQSQNLRLGHYLEIGTAGFEPATP